MKEKTLLFLLVIFYSSVSLAETEIGNYLTEIELEHADSGMENVDCIYVINLPFRPEKWIATREALEAYGMHPNRVNAINGWLLSEEDKQILSGPYPIRMRGGEIGCLLSHVSVINDAFKKNYEVVWICEDDIAICENPQQISALISTLSNIDPDWDVFYTDPDSKNSEGAILLSLDSDFRPDLPHRELSYYRARGHVNKSLLKIRQRFGAYSMLVSKKGIEKILNHFTSMYLWTAYDIDIHYIPNIRQYCMKKDIVTVNYRLPSDIRDSYH